MSAERIRGGWDAECGPPPRDCRWSTGGGQGRRRGTIFCLRQRKYMSPLFSFCEIKIQAKKINQGSVYFIVAETRQYIIANNNCMCVCVCRYRYLEGIFVFAVF